MTPRPPRMDAVLRRHDPTGIATGCGCSSSCPSRWTNQPPTVSHPSPDLRAPRPGASSRRLPEGEERFDLRTPYFAPVVEIHLERRWLAQRWVLTRTEEVMGRPRHRVESQVSCSKPVVYEIAALPGPSEGQRILEPFFLPGQPPDIIANVQIQSNCLT